MLERPWKISYFNARVRSEITQWPVGLYADFLRLTLLMQEHGADLRLPHSRAMGDGLFELRCKGQEGIARAFYCTMVGREIVHPAQLHQKNPGNTGAGVEQGPQTLEGGQTCLTCRSNPSR